MEQGDAPSSGTPTIGDRQLYVASSAIEAYSLDTGQRMWRSPLQQYVPRSLLAVGEAIVVPEATVFALDVHTGRKVWEFTPSGNASLGRAATDGHTVYFGTANHRVYALRAADGAPLWCRTLGKEWRFPAVVRGLAIFGEELHATVEQWRTSDGQYSSGWLFALDRHTGKIRWQFSTGRAHERHGLSSSPTITARLVLASDYLTNAIVAVDRRTGRQAWRFEGERGFVGFPEAPIVLGSRVFAASGDTYAYSLDLTTGRLLWRTQLPAANVAYAICGHSLLVNYGGVAVLDLETGSVKESILDDQNDDPPSSNFTGRGNRAFLLGAKAIYALQCD